MAKKLLTMVISLVLLVVSTGCGNPKVVLHPIQTIDIVRLQKGQKFVSPLDGYFISDFYLKAVMEAKIQ